MENIICDESRAVCHSIWKLSQRPNTVVFNSLLDMHYCTYFCSVDYMKGWGISKINMTGCPVLGWPDWQTDCKSGMVCLQVMSDELQNLPQEWEGAAQ